jgi:diadenosine tetraphosphate (Ap4A) HIT family hydrolase
MSLAPSPFLDRSRWVAENEHAFAIRDGFPVSFGHTLVIPKREVVSVFDLTPEEFASVWALVVQVRANLRFNAQSIMDFTIGVNDGEAAGQTVGHAHVHVIPRGWGDCLNPRGGVRGVIPGKASY